MRVKCDGGRSRPECKAVARILDPRDTYQDRDEWSDKATRLAALFIENFAQYTDTDGGKQLVSAGPILD